MPESSRLNPEITNTIPVNRRMPAGMSLRIFSSVVFNTGCSSLALWRAALSRPTPDHVLTSHAGLDGGSVSFPRTFPCQTVLGWLATLAMAAAACALAVVTICDNVA